MKNKDMTIRLVKGFGVSPFLFLFLFTVFITFMELAGIASVFPFIELVTNTGVLLTNPYYSDIYIFAGKPKIDNLIITVALFLGFFFSLKVFLSYKFLYYKTKVLKLFYQYLYYKLYTKYINMLWCLLNN